MKRRLALVAVVLAAASGAATAAPGAPSSAASPIVLAKTCGSGYVHGIIGGRHKCLRAGEFCAHRYESQYRRYGFTCRIASDGRYRLRRR